MSSILRTQALTKRFRHTEAVNELTFEVPEGSVYAFVGPNGAGKTTTIKLLMNMVTPTSGESAVLNVDSRRLGPEEFRRIGYVSENQELPTWMTVGYFLNYCKAFYPSWDDSLADSLIRQFQLPLDRKLRHLSRGMKMKAALASSLAYRPPLVILDEPFSGLDALVRDELIESIVERADEMTIFLSSHDLAEIESFSSHIGYLDNGRLQFSEELTSLASRVREIEVSLDAPPPVPPSWPPGWLQPETSPALVRFVDTHFDHNRTMSEIRRLFPSVRDVAVNAMPLRSIFVALARAGRKAA
ncbi:MAG: ABC transporter ATP-binding protein [Bryobacteraceae bacterium]